MTSLFPIAANAAAVREAADLLDVYAGDADMLAQQHLATVDWVWAQAAAAGTVVGDAEVAAAVAAFEAAVGRELERRATSANDNNEIGR